MQVCGWLLMSELNAGARPSPPAPQREQPETEARIRDRVLEPHERRPPLEHAHAAAKLVRLLAGDVAVEADARRELHVPRRNLVRVAPVQRLDERIRRRPRADRRQIEPQAVEHVEAIVDRPLILGVHRVVRGVELRVETLAEVQADRVGVRISGRERIEARERVAPLRVSREQIVDLVELVVRADAQPVLRADRDREVVGDLENVLIERIALRVRLGARDQRAR